MLRPLAIKMATNNFLIVLKDLNGQQFDLFLLFFSKNQDKKKVFYKMLKAQHAQSFVWARQGNKS